MQCSDSWWETCAACWKKRRRQTVSERSSGTCASVPVIAPVICLLYWSVWLHDVAGLTFPTCDMLASYHDCDPVCKFAHPSDCLTICTLSSIGSSSKGDAVPEENGLVWRGFYFAPSDLSLKHNLLPNRLDVQHMFLWRELSMLNVRRGLQTHGST